MQLSFTPVKTGSTFVENLPFRQLPDELRHGRSGGVPPVVRASVVRVILAKLAMTGALAAIVAVRASNEAAAFSCALAAAVNFVATAHYWFILKIRSQELTPGTRHMASGRDLKGEWIGRTEDEFEAAKQFAQESAVDGLRHSDWTVTLVFLALDLYELQSKATGGAQSPISKWVVASVLPVMVLGGAIFRFYANELRGRPLPPGATRGNVGCTQFSLGFFAFLASCGLLALSMYGILQPLTNEVCPGANATGTCPITDPAKVADRDAVYVFTFLWAGYPLVAAISSLSPPNSGFRKWAAVSLVKDVLYGGLDVACKGGLAVYVAYRTTWVA